MATLHIMFVGVQAYVPFADRLEIYLPNATRMGDSPQSPLNPPDPLDMHMPTIWQIDAGTAQLVHPENLRYFPWCEPTLSFDGTPSGIDLAAVEAAGGPSADRLTISQAKIADPAFLAGKMVLRHGTAYTYLEGDPQCSVVGWCNEADGDQCADQTSSPPSYPDSSILGRLHVQIGGVTGATLNFTSLLSAGGPVPEPIPIDDMEAILVIGNPCAESHLRWQRNEVFDFPDQDFSWIYQLVAQPPASRPHPIIDQLRTKIRSHYTPQQVLQNIYLGGGGGLGCECMACVAEVGP